MAIPKKRKKMDSSDEELISKEIQEEPVSVEALPVVDEKASVEPTPKKRQARVRRKHTEADVDKAFEVVETLKDAHLEPEEMKQLQLVRKVYTKEEAGIHICFTVDAVQLVDFIKNLENGKEEIKDYLEFDITIPYPWNWPIFNDVAKIVISNLKDMKIIK
jgi:hypothetical protein